MTAEKAPAQGPGTEGSGTTPPVHPAYEVLRPVTSFAGVVLCHNPGTMELDGTNTWILRAPGSESCVVVDPGPKGHKKHIAAVAAAGPVETVVITHRHRDHTGGIDRLAARTGAPVRAWSRKYCRDAEPLRDREVIEAAGLRITVFHTPGHTADSISLLVEHGDAENHGSERAMLTGDTILGRGTTVLDPGDGGLRDYLHSLNRLIVEGDDCVLLPGHGPDHPELIPVARFYKAHREDRIDQIRDALEHLGVGPAKAKPMRVVRTVYADVDKKLWPAARMSVRAQLDYLAGN
ncbi:MBL fold metallo-hydrolase [Williamsia sterculiae]|uniref:Glyoxylase, beta-lactamase superfamily II n=1 Tax=Williamsia sterculiae TaxID=1344003 RepID=A0A1N7F4J9_9NOCA|nr:MBL fold metallo-hydrolase [Williamsia sterculiae]SIR95216.1 Glyoxylase, beta-lactamase superfamily II [Williamsia sterculiae]